MGLPLRIEQNDIDHAEMLYKSGSGLTACGAAQPLSRLFECLNHIWFGGEGAGSENVALWLERLNDAAGLASGESASGRLLRLLAKGKPLPPLGKRQWRLAAKACQMLGRPTPEKQPSRQAVRRVTRWRDEASRLFSHARRIPVGAGPVTCTVFMSKPEDVREKFSKDLSAILVAKGYRPSIRVFNAYKPGVDWLLGEVAALLPPTSRRIKISCQPFEQPGQLELASRWLQELYPAPDILAARLGWPEDAVELALVPGQPEIYRLDAWDQSGQSVCKHSFTPPCSRIPYRLDGQNGSYAYPTCAGIRLEKDGDRLWECRLATDRELFWQRFQERWLPELERRMLSSLPKVIEENLPAFWEEVRLVVGIRETQKALSLDQERIAPMEALHEDLYFGLLSFVQAFCEKHCPNTEIQLGRIVPMMCHDHGEQPFAKLVLKPLRLEASSRITRPPIACLRYRKGLLEAVFSGETESFTPVEKNRFCTIAKVWGVDLQAMEGGWIYRLRPPQNAPDHTAIPVPAKPDLQRFPSGKQTREWVRCLGGSSSLQVWQAGRTLQGRCIQAIEAVAASGMTARRARLLKPTLLINARHHANEVSGSSAVMHLAWQLAFTEAGKALLRHVNVVMIPLENADGVATLEELLPLTPDHKLHAARYNALGMEWYQHYHRMDTPIPEARVKSRLFGRWLPEYLVDLHGVPSHEWEQPFAGYLNPNFREHWIPRSFVYAILPFLDEPDHPGRKIAHRLIEAFAAALKEEDDIEQLNRRIYHRYRRYALAFEPEIFDASSHRSLVAVPTSQRLRQTNYGNRCWPVVKSEVVTEVLDEVVRGPWLEKCCRAHLAIIWVMLNEMSRENRKAVLDRNATPDGVVFRWRLASASVQPEHL